MDLLTLIIDIIDQINEFIENLKKITNEYINAINKLLEELENVINNSFKNSAEYIQRKIDFIQRKIDKILDNFEKKINDFTKGITAWYDKQINDIKINIVKHQQAKLGVTLPEDQIRTLAEAMPHPELTIPKFKIELPEISTDTNVSVSIPRIPTI